MNIEKTQIAELLAGTIFQVEVEAPDGTIGQRETKANMIPNQGLEYFVGILFDGVTPAVDWFIAPYEGNYTPVPTVTAASTPMASWQTWGMKLRVVSAPPCWGGAIRVILG